MGEKTQRVIIWLITILFVASTIGAVAYYVMINKQNEKQQAELQKAIQDQTQPNSDNPATSLQNQNQAKLTGTKMTDFEPIDKINELKYIDQTTGSGTSVKPGDVVTVKYVGALAKNGTIFDASSDHEGGTFKFTVGAGQVIKGWDSGLPGMKVGGKRRLLIPSGLGYGNQSVGSSIPANSDLVFDVEIVKIGS
jgi:FKBP-type peptidyl-prolyl cis-trans isomerase